MKIFNKLSIAIVAVAFIFGQIGLVKAATAVSLGTADNFAVLAGSGITNTGATTITGDIGTYPTLTETGFGSITLNGTNHIGDAVTQGAKTDLTAAYLDAAGQTPVSTVPTELGGTIKTAGIYDSAAGTFGITGTLTLDAEDDPTAVFIFKTASTLITASNSHVSLINGAQACNVFWQVGSSATLGTTSDFWGNILAFSSITDNGGSTINGRLLARNAAVTLNNTTVARATCAGAAPATLHVIKVVNNSSYGTSIAANAIIHVKSGVSDVAGSPQAGAGSPGTSYTLDSGSYTVSEEALAGYTATITGDCSTNGQITLASGDDKTCTITNNDTTSGRQQQQQGTLTVIKTVINDNGGNKTIADFPLFVNGTSVVSGVTNSFPAPALVYNITETNDANYARAFSGDCDADGRVNLSPGDQKICIVTNNDIGAPVVVPPVPPLIDVVKVPSPLALPNGSGLVQYTYTLTNVGTVPVTDITMVGDTCSPVILTSGDTNNDNKLDLNETWIHTCSTTLTETHTNTIVATGWANGLSAIDIASATVVVGVPVVPPLIHITKIPNPLTLLAGGGPVTYTKKVTNPGTVSLSNVNVTDNKCSAINYINGDANGDFMLNPNETWTYTCTTNLTETTSNTAIATGWANGLMARDFAVATVVVAAVVPKLPNTGLPPAAINITMLIGLVMLVSISAWAVLKKHKA